MKIGIISDTHNLLRPETAERLQGCDCILHCGDISNQKILDQLKQIAPVHAVRGNNEKGETESLPESLELETGGLRVIMTHKKKDLPKDLSGYDLALCGHSHQYDATWLNHAPGGRRTLLLNPGSCGPRRLHQPITLALLTVTGDGFTVERIEIPHSVRENAPKIDSGNIRLQIETVLRERKKGKTMEAIASKYGMDKALVEQIIRLYVTHPGVTVDGIMTKMGI